MRKGRYARPWGRRDAVNVSSILPSAFSLDLKLICWVLHKSFPLHSLSDVIWTDFTDLGLAADLGLPGSGHWRLFWLFLHFWFLVTCARLS